MTIIKIAIIVTEKQRELILNNAIKGGFSRKLKNPNFRRIFVKPTEAELEIIKNRAELLGMNVSTYMRMCAMVGVNVQAKTLDRYIVECSIME